MENLITDSIVASNTGWDECGDYGDIQLYNCVLAVDTPKFKKGDKVDTVTFLFSESICQIWKKNVNQFGEFGPGGAVWKMIDEFPIKLVIGQ